MEEVDMDKQGFYHRLDKCPTLIQCSVWNIVTEKEDKIIRQLIKDIQNRNPGCNVKIIFEVEKVNREKKLMQINTKAP